MLSGLNNDIEYKGEVYHVQTEDGGTENPVVTTLLFCGGAICSAKKTNYRDVLKSDSLNEIVREMINEQHRAMIQDLTAGRFDQDRKLKKSRGGDASTPPPKGGASGKKSLDELILDYLSQKYSRG